MRAVLILALSYLMLPMSTATTPRTQESWRDNESPRTVLARLRSRTRHTLWKSDPLFCSMAQRVKGSDSGSTMVHPPPAKEPSAVEYLQIKIPLKPQEKAVAFPQNFAETLQEEYAIKYLQRLGALPTAGNIATVLKHLPLDDCQITSAWKARGSLADVVMVDLYPKPNARLRLAPDDQQADPTMVSSRGDRRRDDASAALHDPLSTDKPYQVGSVCLSFDDMKHRYLLPFRHATRPEADVLTLYAMKHDEPVPFVHIPALADIHTKPVALQLVGRRANQRRIRCIEERATPPEIKQEFITHMLHAFLTALPFVALGVRSDKEQNKLSEFLLHEDLVQLIEASVQYLYLEVFFNSGVWVPPTSSSLQRSSRTIRTRRPKSRRCT
jgi:hypothetical protein